MSKMTRRKFIKAGAAGLALASIPGIILLIAMKYAFKGVTVMGLDLTGIHGIYIALGVISWIGTCRLVRAETMKLRELDYVLAARESTQPKPED